MDKEIVMSGAARKWWFSVALSAATVSAMASDLPVDLADGFSGQKAKILLELSDGETYSELPPEDRGRVIQTLDRMQQVLEGVQSVNELDGNARVAIFNDQETVNMILTRAREDSRLVCERRAQTGSHRRTTVCATVAHRNRQREVSKDEMLNRLNRSPMSAGTP